MCAVLKKFVFAVLLLFTVLLFGGCVAGSIDELYSLPQAQEKYKQLQALIDSEIAKGSEYSAPTAGVNRQSVQLVDIDADGSEEVLAFLKNSSAIPAVCVYKQTQGEYELALTLVGEGASIGRVEYADLDGDGMLEIIVAWKLSNNMATVSAYSLSEWASVALLSVNCTDFRVGDFGSADDLDSGSEVVVLNIAEDGGTVSVYVTDKMGEIDSLSVALSQSMTAADRFRINYIDGDVPAIFVEGNYKDADEKICYLTDLLVLSDGKLKNITLDPDTGDSIAVRGVQIYSQLIDGNSTMDVPFPELLYKQPKITADYYAIDWFTFSADGERVLCASTYHSSRDDWFYVLPEEWREGFTVRAEPASSGERAVVLSTVDEESGEITDRLTIFTFTDENRAGRAKLAGRFVILQSETTIYAAQLMTENGRELSDSEKNEIISRFHIVASEWTTGAV